MIYNSENKTARQNTIIKISNEDDANTCLRHVYEDD